MSFFGGIGQGLQRGVGLGLSIDRNERADRAMDMREKQFDADQRAREIQRELSEMRLEEFKDTKRRREALNKTRAFRVATERHLDRLNSGEAGKDDLQKYRDLRNGWFNDVFSGVINDGSQPGEAKRLTGFRPVDAGGGAQKLAAELEVTDEHGRTRRAPVTGPTRTADDSEVMLFNPEDIVGLPARVERILDDIERMENEFGDFSQHDGRQRAAGQRAAADYEASLRNPTAIKIPDHGGATRTQLWKAGKLTNEYITDPAADSFGTGGGGAGGRLDWTDIEDIQTRLRRAAYQDHGGESQSVDWGIDQGQLVTDQADFAWQIVQQDIKAGKTPNLLNANMRAFRYVLARSAPTTGDVGETVSDALAFAKKNLPNDADAFETQMLLQRGGASKEQIGGVLGMMGARSVGESREAALAGGVLPGNGPAAPGAGVEIPAPVLDRMPVGKPQRFTSGPLAGRVVVKDANGTARFLDEQAGAPAALRGAQAPAPEPERAPHYGGTGPGAPSGAGDKPFAIPDKVRESLVVGEPKTFTYGPLAGFTLRKLPNGEIEVSASAE